MANGMNSNGSVEGAYLVRPRYFPRQVVTAADLTADQTYLMERLRRHNRFLHGCGVVCGLEVLPAEPVQGISQVTVTAGYAISPLGDEIHVPQDETVSLECLGGGPDCTDLEGTPARPRAYLAVRYLDHEVRPVPALPERCAPGAICEFSRFQSGFEFRCLPNLPDGCPTRPAENLEALCDFLMRRRRPPQSREDIPDVFACPPVSPSPWVVLAGVQMGDDGLEVDYDARLQVVTTWHLEELLRHSPYATPIRLQVYSDQPNESRWRVLMIQDEVLADSVGAYDSREDARRDMLQVRLHAIDSEIEDLTENPVSEREDPRFQVFRHPGGMYHWRLVTGHDTVLADSGQDYAALQDLYRDLYRIRAELHCATVEELPEFPQEPTPPEDRARLPVSAVHGIGVVRMRNLNASGINTIGQLAAMDVVEAARIIGVPPIRATGMIAQARSILRGG